MFQSVCLTSNGRHLVGAGLRSPPMLARAKMSCLKTIEKTMLLTEALASPSIFGKVSATAHLPLPRETNETAAHKIMLDIYRKDS